MRVYNLSNSREACYGIHDDANLLPLRKDLHALSMGSVGICSSGGACRSHLVVFERCNASVSHALPTHSRPMRRMSIPACLSVFALSSPFPIRRGIAIKIWDESTYEWKLGSVPELPAQRPNRKSLTQRGPSTSKVPKAAMRTPGNPTSYELQGKNCR